MCALNAYELPKEIMKIERNRKLLGATTAKEIDAQFGQGTFDRSTESGYVGAFTKMLQFEEAAQSQFLIQFNANSIKVTATESESGREFGIKNEVLFFCYSEMAR